ncbi:type III pantothenate kinase [uncultured Thiothrix sp.]|uniref:type III pantothenate kinase n=1 Tax=uncultured Thiothrix sp. TaxID=223185 RepID=UPI002619A37B|nr:type III pantothenate kinase [uncultured Thiothrix sp.]HMT93595.1 type III pantothenate kinase [Thiolinea sp.]
MTTLLIDAGNSRLKWASFSQGQRSSQRALAYGEHTPPSGALLHLQTLMAQEAAEKIVLVHVLGSAFTQALEALCMQLAMPLTIVQSRAGAYGIEVAYPNPTNFGADRFVGLLAARKLLGAQAAIMIDAGTAVTIDAIQADGKHLGGVILPGLQLLSDALIRRTQAAHMSATPFDHPKVFNDNTLQGMGSGCLLSLVGALEGICMRMQEQMSEPAQVLLCGGDTTRLSPQLRLAHQACPDALMEGLQYVAEQDACKRC